jgi:hypothetical protein
MALFLVEEVSFSGGWVAAFGGHLAARRWRGLSCPLLRLRRVLPPALVTPSKSCLALIKHFLSWSFYLSCLSLRLSITHLSKNIPRPHLTSRAPIPPCRLVGNVSKLKQSMPRNVAWTCDLSPSDALLPNQSKIQWKTAP